MKKRFVLIALLFSAIQANAQTLNADDMIAESTNCKTMKCFNDFVITKGFSYASSQKLKGKGKGDLYLFPANNYIKSKNAADISFSHYENDNIMSVGYTTASKEYYQELLNQFTSVQKGFSVDKTKDNSGTTTHYVSNKYPELFLFIDMQSLKDENSVPYGTYHFVLTRHINN